MVFWQWLHNLLGLLVPGLTAKSMALYWCFLIFNHFEVCVIWDLRKFDNNNILHSTIKNVISPGSRVTTYSPNSKYLPILCQLTVENDKRTKVNQLKQTPESLKEGTSGMVGFRSTNGVMRTQSLSISPSCSLCWLCSQDYSLVVFYSLQDSSPAGKRKLFICST